MTKKDNIVKFDLNERSVEDCLKKALADEFSEVLVVGFRSDGTFKTTGSHVRSFIGTLGMIEVVKHDLIEFMNKP